MTTRQVQLCHASILEIVIVTRFMVDCILHDIDVPSVSGSDKDSSTSGSFSTLETNSPNDRAGANQIPQTGVGAEAI